ncbi:MAG TPA: response regulator [Bacteroidia bacterium]
MRAKNVLIVDDDRLLVRVIAQSLETSGYKTFTASNGSDAIDLVADQQIDMIICDIMMPKLSGISFITTIKDVLELDLPVIIISSLETGGQITQNLNYKNIVFLAKPFVYEELMETVDKLLINVL